MKMLLLLFFIFVITACTGTDSNTSAASNSANDRHASILILRDDLFLVGADVADMSTSIQNLGPKNRQIDISVCGIHVEWKTIEKLTKELQASGYNRIGYTTDGVREEQLELCSNYAIKVTAE